jgi:zinc protease
VSVLKESVGKISEALKNEIEKLTNDGPTDEMLKRCKDEILNQRKDITNKNDYWLNILSTYYYQNFDFHSEYIDTLKSITKEDVKKFMKQLVEQGNEIEVIMVQE